MNWNLGDSKRGVFFTLDSVFAIMILVTLFSVFMLLSVETVSTESMHQQLRFQAEDAVAVLAKTKLWEVRHLPVVRKMQEDGTLTQIDSDYSIMEVVGALWANNNTGNTSYAQELIAEVLGPSMPPNIKWEVSIGNETLYNTTKMTTSRFMSTVSNKLVSGYMKGKPHFGYTARAFLNNIKGKSDSTYLFFGGFIGQGEITGYLRGIPADATITNVSFEGRVDKLSPENSFDIFLNGTKCKTVARDPTGFIEQDLTEECKDYVNRGSDTKVSIDFAAENITVQYIGGGYLKVTYQTDIMSTPETGKMRYYFPGVSGIINIFDSFFVPGKITSATGFVNISSNYSHYVKLGKAVLFNWSGSPQGYNETYLTNSMIFGNLTAVGLDFDKISNKTVPIRFGTPEATFLFGGKDSDVVLVTDVSGSMAWCEDQTDLCCGSCGSTCTCPSGGDETCGFEQTLFGSGDTVVCAPTSASWNCTLSGPDSTKKVLSAIQAETDFVEAIFNPGSNNGSMIGIIDYSSTANGTKLLPDLNVTGFTIYPDGYYIGKPQNHTYNVTIKNEGFAPVTKPFTVVIFFYEAYNDSAKTKRVFPINFSVDYRLMPGESMDLSKTTEQNISVLGTAYAWADCGGMESVPRLGSPPNGGHPFSTTYPGVCPAGLDKYGAIEEYLPNYDGGVWGIAIANLKNNVRTLPMKNGVNLKASITLINSTPRDLVYSGYYPLVCRSGNRTPYNQTMWIHFNFTNTGSLEIWEPFNITLKRWNTKCNYWETVNMSRGDKCGGGVSFIYPGTSCSATTSNPLEIVRTPVFNFPPMYGNHTNYGTFIWYIANYTPPTCPDASLCGSVGRDCNDFEDVIYYTPESDLTKFNVSIEIDVENNVWESNETDNWKIFPNTIYRDKVDLANLRLSVSPETRCSTNDSDSNSYSCEQTSHPGDRAPDSLARVHSIDAWVEDNTKCPVVEDFNVSIWTKDEWCPLASKFVGNCNWTYVGYCEFPAEGGWGPGDNIESCYRINSSKFPFDRLGFCSVPFPGYYLIDPGLSKHSFPLYTYYLYSGGLGACKARAMYHSVGVRNITARIDFSNKTIYNYTSITPPQTPLPIANDKASLVNETNEGDNWGYGNVGVLSLPNLGASVSPIYYSQGVQNYRYGDLPTVNTVCFTNTTRGTVDWPYTIDRKVTVRAESYLCPAVGNITTSLWANVSSCGPTGGSGGTKYWPQWFVNLSAGGSKTLDWGNQTLRFIGNATFCALTDELNEVTETSEYDNYEFAVLSERYSDLVPYSSSDGSGWFFYPAFLWTPAPGVVIAPGFRTAYTCYGAKTKTCSDGRECRYRLIGYVDIPTDAPCSVVQNFNLTLGTTRNSTLVYMPYFGAGSAYHFQSISSCYYDPVEIVWTELSNNYVDPGDSAEQKTLQWSGKMPNGKEDYEVFIPAGGQASVPLYVGVNVPQCKSYFYNSLPETDFSNNWYTNSTFMIVYDTPDPAVTNVTWWLNLTDSKYYINVTVLNNNSPSEGNCNTSLQAPLAVQLRKNIKSAPLTVETKTIDNLNAGQSTVLQFIFEGSDVWMDVTANWNTAILEQTQVNNKKEFYLSGTGGSVSPPEIKETSLVLAEKEGKNLLLSAPEDEKRSLSFGGSGSETGTCSLSVLGDSTGGPGVFSKTITITSTVAPTPVTCTVFCRPGLTRMVIIGGLIEPKGEEPIGPAEGKTAFLEAASGRSASLLSGTVTCSYLEVPTDTTYIVSANCSTINCASTSVTARGTGTPTPSCTQIIPNPATGYAPLEDVNVTATYTNSPATVAMYCQAGGTRQDVAVVGVVGGTATATIFCDYPADGTYAPYSDSGATPCTTTVTANAVATPSCIQIDATPSTGAPPLTSVINATYSNPPASVNMWCNTSDPVQNVPVTNGWANITCVYSSAGTYTPGSNYGAGTPCETTVNVQIPGEPYCTLTPYPREGEKPFTSDVAIHFENLLSGTIELNCSNNGSHTPQSLELTNGNAITTCRYETNGTFIASAGYQSYVCSDSVTATNSAFEGYSCPDPSHYYVQENLAYKQTPIYNNSIIRKLGLTNDTEALIEHIEKTKTSFGTCLCCGILEGARMMDTRTNKTRTASMVVMTDGQPNAGCKNWKSTDGWTLPSQYPMTGDPNTDAIRAACYAFNASNLTIFTVAFGGDANRTLLGQVAVACGANGVAYNASDRQQLLDAYQQIAARILNVSYISQSIKVAGSGNYENSILADNSYLEFTYTPYYPEFNWNDVSITVETSPFADCSGNQFDVSANITPYHATATSYSSYYWTKTLKVNDEFVYNLGDFASAALDYREFGDPFNVEFMPKFVPADNNLSYQLALDPETDGGDDACGTHNKVIYKAKFPASVPFSSVRPDAACRKVKVYYDTDGDGTSDGSVDLTIGQGIVGITPCTGGAMSVENLNIDRDTNALADAMMLLLDQLNFDREGGTGPSGSQTNPIDIYIDPNMLVARASSIYEVPYMWGPVDMSVKVWVE